MEIREIKIEDLSEILEIEKKSKPHPWTEEIFRQELKNPSALNLVAIIPPEKVGGYLFSWMIHPELEIHNLAVHPGHRRRGLGETLLMETLWRASQKGVTKAFLEVRKSNQSAIRLYQKMGFQMVFERKKYYQDNQENALNLLLNFNRNTFQPGSD